MKQAALFLLVILFQNSAQASVDFKWDLTHAAANVFVKTVYGANASDAICTVSGTRPTGTEDAIPGSNQKIECRWNAGIESGSTSFAEGKIDSWGQRNDMKSFRAYGESAEKLFDLFQKQTKGLQSPEPKDSMWLRLYLCDSLGGFCTQPVLLNTDADPDAPAQMDCSRESVLTKESTVNIDPSQYDANHYPDYLDDMANAQIKAGERKIESVYCTFIAP